MDKKEKESRLAEHIAYYDLIDKLRDMYIDALDDLSVDSIISALDRIKVEMIQQQVIVEIENSRKQSEAEQSEVDNGSEDEEPVIPIPVKAEMPFVNPMEQVEEVKRGLLNN